MSAEDWHGICHSNGMSGNCGLDCEAFNTSDCECTAEIVESCKPEDLEEYDFSYQEMYDFGFKDYLVSNIAEVIGKLRYEVLKLQTKYDFDEGKEIDKLFGHEAKK